MYFKNSRKNQDLGLLPLPALPVSVKNGQFCIYFAQVIEKSFRKIVHRFDIHFQI